MPFIPTNPKHSEWDYREPCQHPEHKPPGMIVLPEGVHTYQCPGCGKKTTFRVTRPTLSSWERNT